MAQLGMRFLVARRRTAERENAGKDAPGELLGYLAFEVVEEPTRYGQENGEEDSLEMSIVAYWYLTPLPTYSRSHFAQYI